MTIFNVFSLLGGLALFLFGMDIMGKALEKQAGGQLQKILSKLTDNPLKGFFLGLCVTAVIQSSSAFSGILIAMAGTLIIVIPLMCFSDTMLKLFNSDPEVLRYGDPESGGYLGAPMECLWETPWLDLGKAYMKRDFVLRFTADADENDVPVEMTIKTERREKTRVVLLQRQRKDYRVKIQVSGVRMKLKIRSHAKAAGWRIYGGVQAEYSLDEV